MRPVGSRASSWRMTRRTQAYTCEPARRTAAQATERAAKSGMALRCTGPVRQCMPCQPSPACQWTTVSSTTNVRELAAKRNAACAATAPIEIVVEVVTALGSSRCCSLTASEASHTTVMAVRTAMATATAATAQAEGPPVTAARLRPSDERPGCSEYASVRPERVTTRVATAQPELRAIVWPRGLMRPSA